MGRELRRKQAKRDGKNVREIQKKNKTKPLTPKTFIIIMGSLVLFFILLYIITGLFITKELKWFDKEEDKVIEIENKILAADSLRQNGSNYYVYYYDTTEEKEEVSHEMNSLPETVYRVDLNDEFNSNFIGEPSGIVEDINNLKVSNPTVIKVRGKKIVEFYSGVEEIKEGLH